MTHAHTNKLIHKKTDIKSALYTQGIIMLLLATKSRQWSNIALMNVSLCFYIPDTFIEDVEFVVCQTFLLEDSDNSIVDAATPQTKQA